MTNKCTFASNSVKVAAVAAAATVATNIMAENVRTTPPSREVDSALAVFFSDLHVNGREDIGYVHQADHLRRTVSEILALDPLPANAICCGDIAFLWGMPEDYALVREILQPLVEAGIKVTLGIGDHDRRDRFLEFWPESAASSPVPGRVVSVVELPFLDVIVLDTVNDDPIGFRERTRPGDIGEAQRKWLAERLASAKKPVIVCGHHGAKEDAIELADLLVDSPACKGCVNGHWHRWRNDFIYADHDRRLLKSVCIPSTGHWGDIGWCLMRVFPDKAVMELRQRDYFNTALGEGKPEGAPQTDRDLVLEDRKGQKATFWLK